MRQKSILTCAIILQLLYLHVNGQGSLRDSAINLSFIGFKYQGGINQGAWADVFPGSGEIGGELGVKFASNIYLTTGGYFYFADRVDSSAIREVLGDMLIADEFVITSDGLLSPIAISISGLTVPFKVGKIFPVIGPNDNSGLYVELGAKFIQYNYWFRVPEGSVGLLRGEYEKGYDRRTRGFGINEGIGYRHFASNNYVNFSIGLDFSQYRLEDARPIFFPTGELGGTRRWGSFFGVSFGWFFPIYKRAPNKAYYY